jgi:hypothetical protein
VVSLFLTIPGGNLDIQFRSLVLKFLGKERTITLLATQLIFAMLLIILLAINSNAIGIGGDWEQTFGALGDKWLNPYKQEKFTNPPWLIMLFPHVFLPLSIGSVVNRAVTIILIVLVVHKYKAGWGCLIIVVTSLPFLDIIWNNNIDSALFLAILLPDRYKSFGLPILALKPQVISNIALIWWKRLGFSFRFFLPLIGVTLLSFLLWGAWPAHLPGVENSVEVPWNIAIWPYGIPIGLGLLFFAFRFEKNDLEAEIFAAVSTCFLVPYFASYSLIVPFTMLALRYKIISIIVSVLLWIYFVIVGVVLF